MTGEPVRIHSDLEIPPAELSFQRSRSSGPGGQNVNKVESRITLLFDVGASQQLSADQKHRLLEVLATRINRKGVLRVTSSRHRTQGANLRAATERFADLLREALETSPERKPTRPTRSSKKERLGSKRHRSRLKRQRSGPEDWE